MQFTIPFPSKAERGSREDQAALPTPLADDGDVASSPDPFSFLSSDLVLSILEFHLVSLYRDIFVPSVVDAVLTPTYGRPQHPRGRKNRNSNSSSSSSSSSAADVAAPRTTSNPVSFFFHLLPSRYSRLYGVFLDLGHPPEDAEGGDGEDGETEDALELLSQFVVSPEGEDLRRSLFRGFWHRFGRDVTRHPYLLFRSLGYSQACRNVILNALLQESCAAGYSQKQPVRLVWSGRGNVWTGQSSRARPKPVGDPFWNSVVLRQLRLDRFEVCVRVVASEEEEDEDISQRMQMVREWLQGKADTLRELTISFDGCEMVPVDFVRSLADGPLGRRLRRLTFDNSYMNPKPFSGLSTEELKVARMAGREMTLEEDLDPLVRFKSLRRLSLYSALVDESVGVFSSLSSGAYAKISTLSLRFCAIDFTRLRRISLLPRLQRLSLDGCHFEIDQFSGAIDQFCSVLFGSNTDDERESDSVSLREVSLRQVSIEPRGPRIWPSDEVCEGTRLFSGSRFATLQKFDVSGVVISPALLSSLIRNATTLRFLVLDRCLLEKEHYEILEVEGGKAWPGGSLDPEAPRVRRSETIELSLRALHRMVSTEIQEVRRESIERLRELYPAWIILTK